MNLDRKILNIGCGDESYGTHFIDNNGNGRMNLIDCNVDRRRINFPDEYFDEIYTKNLFEHLSRPHKFLIECHRLLKKEGRIILITDNASYSPYYWNSRKSKLLNNLFRCRYGHFGAHNYSYNGGNEDRHYAIYSEEHLVNHFDNAGFEVKTIKKVNISNKFKLLMFISSMILGKSNFLIVGVKK